MALCAVSFVDLQGIRHTAEVEADSLFEAAVYGVDRFRQSVWFPPINPGTKLEVEVRQPATKHELTLAQVERWLASGQNSPAKAMKKAKLKNILVQGRHGE